VGIVESYSLAQLFNLHIELHIAVTLYAAFKRSLSSITGDNNVEFLWKTRENLWKTYKTSNLAVENSVRPVKLKRPLY